MRAGIGRNAVWNVAGVILPSVAGLLAMPLLLHGLGVARLGVFTLALGLIGFSGIFDLGLGRALTQIIAFERGGGASPRQLAGLVRSALAVLFVLGALWGALLWLVTPLLVEQLFLLDGALSQEAVHGLRWIALSLPVALVSMGLAGSLEGMQRFARVNAIRVPQGVASFLLPGLTALLTPDLGTVIASLATVRILALVPWLKAVQAEFGLSHAGSGSRMTTWRLMRFSAWLTVSNVVGPLMVYADRFYLASLFPPAGVALYTVPLDAASRAGALPMSAVNAAFPALAQAQNQSDKGAAIVRVAGRTMLLLWLPPLVVAMLFAWELLALWLNASFASDAAPIFRWLLLGVFLNGFAHIPYAVLQSAGRVDVTAKLHLMELPAYAAALGSLVATFGILGAALAWVTRIALDTALLFVAAARLAPQHAQALWMTAGLAAGGLVALGTCMWIEAAGMRWGLALLAVVVLGRALLRLKSEAFGREESGA